MDNKIIVYSSTSYQGKRYKYLVLSRYMVRDYQPDCKSILISITSPGDEHVSLKFRELYLDVLPVKFHDIDEEFISEFGVHYKPMGDEVAKKILEFVKKYENDTELIVINCDAGISRSAGVCAALMTVYEGNDDYAFNNFLPNRYVRGKILEMNERDKIIVV